MGSRRRRPHRLADDIPEPRRFCLGRFLGDVLQVFFILLGVAGIAFLLLMYRFLF